MPTPSAKQVDPLAYKKDLTFKNDKAWCREKTKNCTQHDLSLNICPDERTRCPLHLVQYLTRLQPSGPAYKMSLREGTFLQH